MSTPEPLSEAEQLKQERAARIEDYETTIPNEAFNPEQELDWNEWQAERDRTYRLDRLEIDRAELPEPYGSALGQERATRLGRAVEDRHADLAAAPPPRDELRADARKFGAAARGLNVELSEHVVALERDYDKLEGSRREAMDGDRDVAVEALSLQMNSLRQELTELSKRPDHPDRWIEQDGGAFVDSLAARERLRSEREMAAAEQEQVAEPAAPERDRDLEGTGVELF